VKESVDDGIHKAVAHCQPVYCRVDDDKEVLLRDGLVLGQVRPEVDEEDERMQRQPADGEDSHNDHQHLYHLRHLHATQHSDLHQSTPSSKIQKRRQVGLLVLFPSGT